ncbi:MAG: hypothetical protein V4585_21155 [Bacteroidota bacterium]
MKTTTIIVNVIMLIGLIPSLFSAMMSPMMFDAPGSDKNTNTWILFSSVISLPILIIITQIISWIAFANQNYNLALKINTLPIADIIFIGILLFTISNFGR